jgi:hypothetical protein
MLARPARQRQLAALPSESTAFCYPAGPVKPTAVKSLRLAALCGAYLSWTATGLAQEADSGAQSRADEPVQKRPAYYGSFLFWEHNVSAETVGVGNDVQSSNPTYTMGLGAKGRWYFLDEPGKRLSVRGDVGVYREFTNSDSTTRRGETSPSDTELALSYVTRIRGAADSDGTLLELRPLTLVLPTSRASFNAGRYFAPGVLVGISHVGPLLKERFQPELGSVLSFMAGYKRWFARATVPTSPSLELVRVTSEGRSVPTDQLSGSSLIRDELSFIARWALSFGDFVTWTTDFGLQPAWKYDVTDQVDICGVVDTGCTTVELAEGDSRYLLRTLFNVELAFEVVKSLSLAVGYANVANQLGPDGRRRGMFYSPEASFYAGLAFTPHELSTTPKRSAWQAGPATF